MIITTTTGRTFDTGRDLTAAERHILQKLFLWEEMAVNLDRFREEKAKAFGKGWSGSGPIKESPVMTIIISDMEKRLLARLQAGKPEGHGD
ncbi:MAG: hypothetical protein ACM3MN_09875 [Nitrospirota bacterium]